MTLENKCRFCKSCEQTVVDFTEMTDKEIYNFLEKQKGQKVCGRFRNNQLQRPIRPEFQAANKSSVFKIAASILVGVSVFIPSVSNAQNMHQLELLDANAKGENDNHNEKHNRQIVFEGHVFYNDSILPYAVLEVNGNEYVMADENGNFRFEYNGDVLKFKFRLIYNDENIDGVKSITIDKNMESHFILEKLELVYTNKDKKTRRFLRRKQPKDDDLIMGFVGGYTL